LEIFEDGLPLSMEQSYMLLDKETGPYKLQHYLAYSHLKRLGFVVIRSGIYDASPPEEALPKLEEVSIKEQKVLQLSESCSNIKEPMDEEKPCQGWYPAFHRNKKDAGEEFEVKIIPVDEKRKNNPIDYSQLQLFQPLVVRKCVVERQEEHFIAYDVYNAQGFSKKKIGPPAWRLCVVGYNGQV